MLGVGRAHRVLASEASILTWRFVAHGIPIDDALWRGTFHAISAFCNAGFALQTDSIIMFSGDAIALAVHAMLIVLGGFGFVVLAWMWARIVRRVRSRPPVQVQVVLVLSAAFGGLGALVYAVLEWNHTLTGLSLFDKVTNAIFQSVTMRTEGFNSVDLMAMRPAPILLTITLMFIGAAP